MRVRKGDLVQILTGKDRGKRGRILDAQPRAERVIVENLNVAHRHQKPQPIRDTNRMGGSTRKRRCKRLEWENTRYEEDKCFIVVTYVNTFAVVSVHRGWVWVVRVRLYFLAPVYSWC